MKDLKIFDVSHLTATSVTAPISNAFDYDFVARISGSTKSNLASVSVANTSSLLRQFSEYVIGFERDINVLKGVVNWQHKVIDYNSSYTAFLMEQITEEEFEQVAIGFAEAPVEISAFDLAYDIERIHTLTGIDYSVMDYANMFGASEDAVEDAARTIANGDMGLRMWSEGIEL